MTLEEMLGKDANDTVTGFHGTVTGVGIYLGGPARVEITAVDREGKPVECWFNLDRVHFAELPSGN